MIPTSIMSNVDVLSELLPRALVDVEEVEGHNAAIRVDRVCKPLDIAISLETYLKKDGNVIIIEVSGQFFVYVNTLICLLIVEGPPNKRIGSTYRVAMTHILDLLCPVLKFVHPAPSFECFAVFHAK
jgi:hypothetical protein